MYVRITWGRLNPGSWDEYEAAYVKASDVDTDIPGFRGRLLARDTDDADTGVSISFWDSREELESYEQGTMKEHLLPLLNKFFAGEYSVSRFEVRHERGLGFH